MAANIKEIIKALTDKYGDEHVAEAIGVKIRSISNYKAGGNIKQKEVLDNIHASYRKMLSGAESLLNGNPSQDAPDWKMVVELQKQIIALQSKENSSLQIEISAAKETIAAINVKVDSCNKLIVQANELSRESNRLASEANKSLKSLEGLAELAKVAKDQDSSERKDFPPYVKDRSRAKK